MLNARIAHTLVSDLGLTPTSSPPPSAAAVAGGEHDDQGEQDGNADHQRQDRGGEEVREGGLLRFLRRLGGLLRRRMSGQ